MWSDETKIELFGINYTHSLVFGGERMLIVTPGTQSLLSHMEEDLGMFFCQGYRMAAVH